MTSEELCRTRQMFLISSFTYLAVNSEGRGSGLYSSRPPGGEVPVPVLTLANIRGLLKGRLRTNKLKQNQQRLQLNRNTTRNFFHTLIKIGISGNGDGPLQTRLDLWKRLINPEGAFFF